MRLLLIFLIALFAACATNNQPEVVLQPDEIRANRLDFRKGSKFYQEREYAAAAPYFENVLERDPNNAEALYRLGQCYALTGRRTEARRFLSKLETLNKTYAVKLAAILN